MVTKEKIKSVEKEKVEKFPTVPDTKKRGLGGVLRQKSKTRLFWEKYPDGIGSEIINMRAVLR